MILSYTVITVEIRFDICVILSKIKEKNDQNEETMNNVITENYNFHP